jgi:hypothetical protein
MRQRPQRRTHPGIAGAIAAVARRTTAMVIYRE